MSPTPPALIRDFVDWLADGPKPYAEVMEAWRTSCPRLPVWEEANSRGLVTREVRNGAAIVTVTGAGQAFLTDRKIIP